MATRFPKFSQVLSEDPTTRRIWYSIATAHDLESHDDVSEEAYEKFFNGYLRAIEAFINKSPINIIS